MKHLKQIISIVCLLLMQLITAQTKKSVADFNKVIISPHIETTFVKGDENSVTILENTLSDDKVNIEVNGGTLRVYLDDAKTTTKHKKVVKNGMKMKVPIYKGRVLTIKVTYKNIDNLSLRGEQRTVCESLIDAEEFKLKIYGESQVTFNEVDFQVLNADIYGESQLTINKGKINHQWITAFGEGEINLVEVDNKTSKLKAYGEAKFTVQSSERIKFTAYGEAELFYKGDPEVYRGLSIGASTISQID
ncbi:head GIN domain-containing protein [Winogradskyella haliclonae]|nr:head GIN domain-containing protein [Winogradskyella haliclonae]